MSLIMWTSTLVKIKQLHLVKGGYAYTKIIGAESMFKRGSD